MTKTLFQKDAPKHFPAKSP